MRGNFEKANTPHKGLSPKENIPYINHALFQAGSAFRVVSGSAGRLYRYSNNAQVQ